MQEIQIISKEDEELYARFRKITYEVLRDYRFRENSLWSSSIKQICQSKLDSSELDKFNLFAESLIVNGIFNKGGYLTEQGEYEIWKEHVFTKEKIYRELKKKKVKAGHLWSYRDYCIFCEEELNPLEKKESDLLISTLREEGVIIVNENNSAISLTEKGEAEIYNYK